MTLDREDRETMEGALEIAKYTLFENLFQTWRKRNENPEHWDNVIKETNRKLEAVKAAEKAADGKDTETILEALDIAKDHFFLELLDMNRQRVDSPQYWSESAWLKLTRKYNAAGRLKSTIEKELAQA